MFDDLHAPYRIESARTVIRCWDPRDSRLLQNRIDRSLDSLRPWMPWAKDEPKDFRSKTALLRRFRGDFDLGNDFVFGIFTLDESEVLGGCGLHTRAGAFALEIGYWIGTPFQNRGYATETTTALMKVAFELSDVDNLQIACATTNERSLRVIEKTGFHIEGTLHHRAKDSNGEFQDLVTGIYLRKDYGGSAIERARVLAFNVLGETILDTADGGAGLRTDLSEPRRGRR